MWEIFIYLNLVVNECVKLALVFLCDEVIWVASCVPGDPVHVRPSTVRRKTVGYRPCVTVLGGGGSL